MAAAGDSLDPRRRADRDDRSTVAGSDHRRHDGLDGVAQPRQVDVDDVLPLLGRNFPQPAPVEHTCVGHHDIQAAELFDRFGHQPLLGGQISDVDVIGEDLAALALDQADRLGEVFRRRGG
jgi:hypothetical protein